MADDFIIHWIWVLWTIFYYIVFFLSGSIFLFFSKLVLGAWPSLREMPWYVIVVLSFTILLSLFFFYNSLAAVLSVFGLSLPGSLTYLLNFW